MLHVFQYITDVVHMCDCQDKTNSLSAMKVVDKDKVGKCADTWHKRIEPTETVEYSAVVAWQNCYRACVR